MLQRLREALEGAEGNYILPFFWVHGESEELLREGMRRIRESGIRAVCVESRPHPDFTGEGWWRDMDVILDEAERLDMRVWVLDDQHFPSGYANGKVGENSPYGKVLLDYYHIDVRGPMRRAGFLIDLQEGESLEAVTAGVRDGGSEESLRQVRDLTGLVKEGILYWDVPEGDWIVTVLKTTRRGKMRQGYINTLDREAVRFFLDTVYEPHYERYGELFGGRFAGFFSDEPEIGNAVEHYRVGHSKQPLPWCGQLERLLRESWGEEYGVLLTALFCDVRGASPKARADFMDRVTRLYGENFCGQIGDWCRSHGVEYIGHVIEDNGCHARLGLGTGHYFRALMGQDMAGIDVVLQQIRPGFGDGSFHAIGGKGTYDGRFFHYGLAALGVSLAYLDPKKKGRTVCELFGAYGWAEGLKLMKWLTDHMLVRGVNNFVPHAFTMKEFPDPDCPPHFYARGNNPQYPYFGRLMSYMNRVSHLLHGGTPLWEVGIFYNACAEWAGEWQPFEEAGMLLARAQIPYAVIPEDALRGEVSLRTLVVPYCEYLPESVLALFSQAAGRGLRVVFLEKRPTALETGRTYEGGTLLPKEELARYLCENGTASAVCESEVPDLRFLPYRQPDGELYLFFNESASEEIDTLVSLPQAGGDVSRDAVSRPGVGLWRYDAFDNRLYAVGEESCEKGRNRVRLRLSPGEACIFCAGAGAEEGAWSVSAAAGCPGAGEGAGRFAETEYCYGKSDGCLAEVGYCPGEDDCLLEEFVPAAGGWRVRMEDRAGKAPAGEAVWQELEDVTSPERFPDFCGAVEYETVFDCPGAEDAYGFEIDCGEVFETMELWLNGVSLGVRIAPPYRLWGAGGLKEAGNELRVRVVNTLAHRQRDHFSRSLPVEPSGLLGPVKIRLWKRGGADRA